MYAVITCVEEAGGGGDESFAVKVVLAGKVPPTNPHQKVPKSPFVGLLRLNSFLPPRGTSYKTINEMTILNSKGKLK